MASTKPVRSKYENSTTRHFAAEGKKALKTQGSPGKNINEKVEIVDIGTDPIFPGIVDGTKGGLPSRKREKRL